MCLKGKVALCPAIVLRVPVEIFIVLEDEARR